MATPLEMEITVHGGFDVLYSVLHGISLLFGAKDFHVAVTMFLLLFFTVTAAFSALSFLWGESKSPWSWSKPFLISYIIYWGLLIPAGTIHLYDDVKNQYAKIDGIPLLIVAISSYCNQIENVLGELLETAIKPPLPVNDLAWGEAFDVLTGAYSYDTSGLFTSIEDYRSRSLWMYINKCVDVEVSIGHISVNALWRNNDWCSDVLAKADNPALYTVVYDPSFGSDTINCKDAWYGGTTDHGHKWEGLEALICNDSSLWADIAATYCTSVGWGDSTTVVNRCKQILANSAKFCLYPLTPSAGTVLKNSFIARKMADFVSQYSTTMDQARLAGILATQSNLASVGMLAAEYIPLMREATFALVFLITPILVLLVNTPFVKEVLRTMLGLFLFVAFWGIVDRGITALHFNLAYDLCQTLRNQGFGMGVLFDMPRIDTKIVTILGYMRLTGAMLAGMITFGVLKVGGYFLANFAGRLSGAAVGGASSAASYATPEGRLAHYEQAAKAAAAFGAAANWRHPAGMFWDDVRKEMEQAQMARAARGSILGEGGTPGAASLMATAPAVAQLGGLLKSIGGAGGFKNWLTSATAKYQADWTEGLARGAELQNQLENVKKEFGLGNDLEAARYALANPEVSKRFGQNLGLLKEYAAMKKAGVIGSDTSLRDYIAQREAIRGMLGGADVFAFARKAGEMGLSPAQAAYAKSLFSWGKEMSHLNELMKRFKGKDLSQLTPEEIGELGNTLGRVYGAFEHARTTAGGIGVNAAIFSEYQKGLNVATKFFANAAAAWWLNTGILPSSVKQTLDTIASTPEGKRLLQKHLSNLEVSGLTKGQAKRINEALAAKGLDTRFRPGDAAALHLAYTGDQENPFEIASARAVSGAERTARDTTRETNVPGMYVAYGGRTLYLRNANVEHKGREMWITGRDKYGNMVSLHGTKLWASGSGTSKKDPILLTGVEKKIIAAGGSTELKSGQMGRATLTTLIMGDAENAASYIQNETRNNADALALANQFASELPVNTKHDRMLLGQLQASLAAGAYDIPVVGKYLKKAGINAKGLLVSRNQDSTSTDLIKALSYEILKSYKLSPEEKVKTLRGILEWVNKKMEEVTGGEKALSKPPENILEPQVSRVVSKEMIGFVGAVGAAKAVSLLSDLAKYGAERLRGSTPGAEGIRSVFKDVYTRAVTIAPQLAAQKAGALAVAALGLATAYYGATHPGWAKWIGEHGGEIGKVIGEKGGEMAEAAVTIGKEVVQGLKTYDNWADHAAEKFLEKVVPGYNNLPEKE